MAFFILTRLFLIKRNIILKCAHHKVLHTSLASLCPIVQWHSPKYQEYCALFDKSTKIDTYADYHLISIFGYGGAPKCSRGNHRNLL